MVQDSRTFRIFISSTFSDLKEERNALQEKVFPRLRDLCEWHGCRFQAIDLRWGVSEQESLNQDTMRICLREIKRCQQITPRPNFIILLGDRYGWRPLPEEIPACEFVEIKDQLKGLDSEKLLTRWYRRDDNAVPPVYNLQPRDGIFQDYQIWERQVESPLRKAMMNAVVDIQLPDSDLFKIGASATHQEIISGALGVENAREHIFCFLREIQGLAHNDNAARYLDLDTDGNLDHKAKKRLKELKNELQQRLRGNIHRYKAKWTRGDITRDHIDRLCEDVYERLSQVILKEIERLKDVDPLEEEIDAHETFGRERAVNFIGRSEPLEAIDEYVGKGNCQPFAVWGESGCGKSALVAKLVQEVTETHLESVVVYRFIGSTPDSSSGRALLEGLCREISQRYGANEGDIPSDYRELVVEFPKRLALATIDKPLVVFLDALDQLSDMDNARSLNWLPADLPNEVRLVISTTRGKCLDALEQKLPPGNKMELQPMTYGEGSELLNLWLTDAGRTLQPWQRNEVLNNFKKCRLPLYLKMAFEEARRWRSYDKIHDISKNTDGIISDLLTHLSSETKHGEMLVSHSLGYLATSKNGLSENEMLDVLSSDNEVMGEFRRRSPRSPLVDSLPVVLWSRLYADLEPYMAKRTADGSSLITFYHRQLRAGVEKKFLGRNRKEARHSALAKYFGQQSLYAQENDRVHANLRMLSELPYQQTHSGQWEKLLATLTNFNFLQVKVEAVGPQPLIEDYSEAFQAECQSKPLASVQDLLRLSTHVVSDDPTQLASQIIGRLAPTDEPSIQNLIEQVRHWTGSPWLCPHLPSLITAGGPLLHTLMGHADWVEAVVVTPDGQRVISASDDTTLKVWDLTRHEELHTLTGHTGPVLDIALTSDGQKAVSSSADGTIKVWDLGRLVELRTLVDHSGDVLAVDITPDGNRILSGAADGTLKVWDLERGEELFELSGHTDWVRDVIATPDGRRALSVSDDKTLRVWDLEEKTELQKILAHNERINAVAVTPDGRRAITASADNQIKVWDISNGKMLFPLSGHGDWVRALTVTPNGRQLISASDDQTLRVWDLEKETLLHILTGHTKAVWDVAVMQDGQQVISGSGDRTLKIWDLRRAGPKGPLFGHSDWGVTAVAVMPDGRTLVSGSPDKTLKVWDLERGDELMTLAGHEGGINGLAVTPDGRRLISCSMDKTLIVWDMEQRGKILHTLEGHTDWVNAVAVTPDGKRIVSASHDNSLSVWDIERGEELQSLFGHNDDVTGVAITADGQHAISASSDKTLKIWDLEQGEEMYTLFGHEQGLRDVAVTPDGRWAISASEDMTLKLWDLRQRTEVRTFSGHKGIVWAVAVTPDGQRVISASEDKTLRLWNLEDGCCVAAFTAESSIRACATAPNSVTFVAGENNARLHVLSLKEGQFTHI